MADFWETGLILRTLAGSRAHGLAREGSDTDSRGVCIPPARYLVGLSTFEQHDEGGDHVTYALAKFVRLCLQGNPNVLESLFVDPDDVLFVDDSGAELLAAREAFLSREVGRRFLGYADAQRKRLDRHHRWLADPPTGPPDPSAYGARSVEGRFKFPDADLREAFDAAQKHWNHFQTWREERNPKRAELEAAYGYDTKHALHLIRLLRMGREVLERGVLLVRRPDAEELLSVRDGALMYEELVALAERESRALEAALVESPLPEDADRELAEALVVRLHIRSLGAIVEE